MASYGLEGTAGGQGVLVGIETSKVEVVGLGVACLVLNCLGRLVAFQEVAAFEDLSYVDPLDLDFWDLLDLDFWDLLGLDFWDLLGLDFWDPLDLDFWDPLDLDF